MQRMSPQVDNRGVAEYLEVLGAMASRAAAWSGPIVVVGHVDPDGDALGSCLALARALRALGQDVTVPLEPPRYLNFLAEPGELSPALTSLPANCLLFVLDVSDKNRAHGAPLDGAAVIFNIDHHGTNDRFGDLAVVEPDKAACALLVKEFIDALPVSWNAAMATPCLTGILTDTGNFRHGNTNREALTVAGELVDYGVDYAELTDRLQWRHPTYFKLLGEVMTTVRFDLDGQLVSASLTEQMRISSGADADDSDDFVGLIRHAEGTRVAALLKQRGAEVKVSVRSRGGASAQRICLEMGGGGHMAAAGATVAGDLEQAHAALLAATERELARA